LIHRGGAVSTERLVDELWGETPPPTAAKTVQVYVSRLRRVLGEGVLTTRDRGYALETGAVSVDLDRLEQLLAEGRRLLAAGAADAAVETLRTALALWRGAPLADLAYEPFAQTEVARLEELRLAAVESRVDAELAAGHGEDLVAELEGLVRTHPFRERLHGQLMRALYRAGRQAEALETYRRLRGTLDAELGLEPGPELRALEQAILRQDPDLGQPRRVPAARRTRSRAPVLLGAAAIVLAGVAAAAVWAVSRGGGSAGLASLAPNSLGLIDAGTNRITAQIPVGARPGPLAVGSGSVWVANLDDATVSRVDVRSRRVVRTIPVGDRPAGLTASGGHVWVTTNTAGLLRIDPVFDSVETVATVGRGEVFPRLESRPVTAGFGSLWTVSPVGTVTRVKAGGRLLSRVDVGNGAAGIAAGAGSLWVANAADGTVSRLDPAGVATATIPVGHGPTGVAFGGGAVWVTNRVDGTLVRIDPATNAVTATVPVGPDPQWVVATVSGIWVAVAGRSAVVRVDPKSARPVRVIPTGGRAVGLAVSGDSVWVTVQAAPPVERLVGGTLRIEREYDFFTPLDPALVGDLDSAQVLYATCAKLMNYPDTAGPAGSVLVPEVAESAPTVSADGRTYTFRIRAGFRFSPPSTEPVTAASFERALERVLTPRMHASYAGLFENVVGAKAFEQGRAPRISGVTARGDALTIRLVEPAGDFLARLAMPAMCAVPTNAPFDPDGVPTLPAAGPYYVASYTPGVQLVLRRNPHYRGSRPHRVDAIVYRIGVGQEQSVRNVEAGRADYAAGGFPPELARQLERRYGPRSAAARNGRQRYFSNPIGGVRMLVLNSSRGVFADPTMRRAAAAAVDRSELAATLRATFSAGSQGGGPATAHLLPPAVPGAPPLEAPPPADLALARRLARGRSATALMYTCNKPPCPQVARLVKRDLARIGIDVTVELLPTAVMFGRALAPNSPWDIITLGWVFDYPDPASSLDLIYAPGQNFPRFFDRRYAERFAAASQLVGPARLRAFERLAADLEADAVPVIPYEIDVSRSFFSRRTGCQGYQPVYGIDLAALCLRR
jgi:YVTN family beta-propeller protein